MTSAAPLLVQAYVDGIVINGVTRQTTERMRLVDVLNAGDEAFVIESARFQQGGAAREYPRILVDKRELIAVVPFETEAQQRGQAQYRIGMSRQATVRQAVGLYSPPYLLSGTAHLATALPAERLLQALSRFFVLTDATLVHDDGASSSHPVVVANRDTVTLVCQA